MCIGWYSSSEKNKIPFKSLKKKLLNTKFEIIPFSSVFKISFPYLLWQSELTTLSLKIQKVVGQNIGGSFQKLM